ncbi:MAG: hypothetical protein R3E50_10770 [Halioglobus sp.]
MRADAWTARHNLPLGGIYILHATKQVVGLHRPRRLLCATARPPDWTGAQAYRHADALLACCAYRLVYWGKET